MGAKCAPESAAYEKVMQINAVRCSDPLSEKSTVNGVANPQPVRLEWLTGPLFKNLYVNCIIDDNLA